MKFLDKQATTNAHLQGVLFQNLAWVVAAFQGARDPRAVEFVNPYEQLLKQAEAKERLDRRVAKTFLALSKENKIPTWVVSYVDVQLIRNAAK